MGEVFAGRYELADPIGRGGVGAVWRAWDHRRRRYVAAKVLQQRDAHSLLRFVREQALRIDHPHVLAPASWAADDDQVLFTMDLVGGGSLAHLVGDYGPLPPAFVCTLLDQLLSGLAAVHAEGVVHRDIKPANVLLEATGTGRPRLRLSDFGIAMRFGEPRLTETNLVVGTPGYLAPEQLLGSDPDFPADLFAVGLVALYLLEGAKPDAKALVEHFVEHGTPGPPMGVPEPLWQVVATLLQPDPAARFRTATGARKALAAAAELLPEPGPDDELIEVFDQLGPLPPGFGPDGPLKPASGVREGGSARGTREADADGTENTAGPAPAVVPRDPRRGGDGTPDATPSSMSDTGSFHLPPPLPYAPGLAHEGGGQAQHSAPHPTEHPPTPGLPYDDDRQAQHSAPHPTEHPPTPGLPYDDDRQAQHSAPHPTEQPPTPPTGPYAAWRPAPAAPPLPQAWSDVEASTASYTAQDPRFPAPERPVEPRPAHGRRARRAGRRPGPPAKAAIPILLLALACYAVGFWALTRV